MHTDPRSQAQALEFLFLFHACKLTNNRPDQSVSLSDVARVSGLNQDQSEQLCTSLREARLIRYSSLLGDISVTRFGVSEVVTTKACPHTGANYFPAVRQMGLKFSRGHHLFDEVELSLKRHYGSDQKEAVTHPTNFKQPADLNRNSSLTHALSEVATTSPEQTQWSSDQTKTASQTRQEVISELEHLLDQLDGKTEQANLPRQPSILKPSKLIKKPAESTAKIHSAYTPPPVASAPSLLLSPTWKPGVRIRGKNQLAGNGPVTQSCPVTGAEQDMAGRVENLHALMMGWCQRAACSKETGDTRDFLTDLEKINESLFSFT